MEELCDVGGVPAVQRLLLQEGLLHGDCMTVTGKTLAENLDDLPDLKEGQQIMHAHQPPDQEDRAICRSSTAIWPTEGAVAKITGKEGTRFSGPAKVFDSEEVTLEAIEQGRVTHGDVVVIRYEGPKGGPGHARDAFHHLGHHGRGAGQERGADHRRALLRRHARLCRGPHHARGVYRRRAGAGAAMATSSPSTPTTNSLNVDLSDEELAARARRLASACAQVHQGRPLQVHEDGVVGVGRLRDRRIAGSRHSEANARNLSPRWTAPEGFLVITFLGMTNASHEVAGTA